MNIFCASYSLHTTRMLLLAIGKMARVPTAQHYGQHHGEEAFVSMGTKLSDIGSNQIGGSCVDFKSTGTSFGFNL